MYTYLPNIKKILRDIAILGCLIYLGVSLRVGYPVPLISYTTIFILLIGLVYLSIMGILPYVKINNHVLQYRTDFGLTHIIKLSEINRINKGSGLGGYEHALFIYHGKGSNVECSKIKTSYYNKSDIKDVIHKIQEGRSIEINKELEMLVT